MGWKRSHEMIEYKEKIMQLICDNPTLVRLLTPDKIKKISDDFDPTEILPYHYLIPYPIIPDTQTEIGRFLTFVPTFSRDRKNKVLKNTAITFTMIAHKDSIRYDDKLAYPERKGRHSCWWDLVLCELDEMFCGENSNKIDFGIGEFVIDNLRYRKLDYQRELPYAEMEVTFVSKDFVDGYRYGK